LLRRSSRHLRMTFCASKRKIFLMGKIDVSYNGNAAGEVAQLTQPSANLLER
jgi:hypothetical protein